MVLKSLKKWTSQLPEKKFVRIHRSCIANIEYIDRIEKWFNNTYRAYLKNKTEPLEMSRRYAADLKKRFDFMS